MLKNPNRRSTEDLKFDDPKKGKLRIMPISDSPWAPTGFGTNTKNVAAILRKDGHHIGYGGCQNPRHDKYEIPWPLNQTKTTEEVELLPIMFPGKEKYGEEAFKHWVGGFKPDIVLTHLDFQMFAHVAGHKQPTQANIPLFTEDNKRMLNRQERADILTKMYKKIQAGVP